MQLDARALVRLWTLGFILSLVIQSVFQAAFGASTTWGNNTGWQTEIALWNLGAVVVLSGLLKGDAAGLLRALPGLTLLSLGLGMNHLIAWFGAADGTPSVALLGHKAGALGNTLGVALAVPVLARARTASPVSDVRGSSSSPSRRGH